MTAHAFSIFSFSFLLSGFSIFGSSFLPRSETGSPRRSFRSCGRWCSRSRPCSFPAHLGTQRDLAVDRGGGGHVCSGYGAVSYWQAEKIRLLKIEIRPVELFLQAGFSVIQIVSIGFVGADASVRLEKCTYKMRKRSANSPVPKGGQGRPPLRKIRRFYVRSEDFMRDLKVF